MFPLAALVVLVSALLVYADASRLRRERGLTVGPANQSPAEWAIATALLWLVVVPYYLIVRNRPVDETAKPRRSGGAQIARGCLFGLLILGAIVAAIVLLPRLGRLG